MFEYAPTGADAGYVLVFGADLLVVLDVTDGSILLSTVRFPWCFDACWHTAHLVLSGFHPHAQAFPGSVASPPLLVDLNDDGVTDVVAQSHTGAYTWYATCRAIPSPPVLLLLCVGLHWLVVLPPAASR